MLSEDTSSVGAYFYGEGTTQMQDEATCPICLKQIEEAFITTCGHSYCYQCISTYLRTNNNCPSCKSGLSMSQIFPNYTLNNIIEKAAALHAQANNLHLAPAKQLEVSLMRNEKDLSINDINGLLATLMEKKAKMEAEEKNIETEVLLDFLQHTREQKQREIERLSREVALLDEDIKRVEKETKLVLQHSGEKRHFPETKKDGIIAKKRKIMGYMDALETCYFGQHSLATGNGSLSHHSIPVYENGKGGHGDKNGALKGEPDDGALQGLGGLDLFTKKLSKLVQFTSYELITTLKFGDVQTDMSVVSSIAFDRDEEFFAMGGVTKKLRIYEYGPVVSSPMQLHFPVNEIKCDTKLSCIRWSPYIKLQVAASGYNGQVYIWDAATNQSTASFSEHEKRIWSIDYSAIDPIKLASASDDARVKVWALNQKRSVMTIEGGVNICSVKFHPTSATYLAYGSSDHNVYYYDLRNISRPLFVMQGHHRAVSSVEFLNSNELVSASIDSTLRLWTLDGSNKSSVRTFADHKNQRNFVGLAVVMGDYITVGGEDNTMATYYKEMNRAILTYDFGAEVQRTSAKGGVEAQEQECKAEETSAPAMKTYISAICAKRDSNKVLAANSRGVVKVLRLV